MTAPPTAARVSTPPVDGSREDLPMAFPVQNLDQFARPMKLQEEGMVADVLGRCLRLATVSPVMRFDRRDRRHRVTIYNATKPWRNIASTDRQSIGRRGQ